MLVFLSLNHIEVEYDDDELIQMILGIAAGEMDDRQLQEWLWKHII